MAEEARAILNENLVGSIATVNQDGSPWVTPVHIFSDENAVYWFSNEDTQHSFNVARDPRVSLALFSPDASRGPKGVYVNGTVTVLGVEETTEAKKLMEVKIGKVIPAFENATAYKLEIGQFNRGKSVGNCWYFYS